MTKLILKNKDCFDYVETLADNSIDVIISDPPYGIGFMGKKWDDPSNIMNKEHWAKFLRILKPGGHMAVFADKNKQHRLHVAIEDAGFTAKDTLLWMYGSGFPKGQSIANLIDKSLGFDGEVISKTHHPQAEPWEGWKTPELKPAYEPILWFQKPYEKTLAHNTLKYGVGGVNIGECGIPINDGEILDAGGRTGNRNEGYGFNKIDNIKEITSAKQERFPANILHDGSQELYEVFPTKTSGKRKLENNIQNQTSINGVYSPRNNLPVETYGDSGSVLRFFWSGKAAKSDREKYCIGSVSNLGGGFLQQSGKINKNAPGKKDLGINEVKFRLNYHPTVKPIELMKWLITLFAPSGATILDPFMGSGSTGIAAIELDRDYTFIGVEKENTPVNETQKNPMEYYNIAKTRLLNCRAEIESKKGGG